MVSTSNTRNESLDTSSGNIVATEDTEFPPPSSLDSSCTDDAPETPNTSNAQATDPIPAASATTTATATSTSTASATATSKATATATELSKKQRKRLEKRERAQRAKRERKQREKDDRRAAAVLAGRDPEAEQRFVAERTASGDRRRRLDEIWSAKRGEAEAERRFRICIDLGSRDSGGSSGSCSDRCDRSGSGPGSAIGEGDPAVESFDERGTTVPASFESAMREREIASLAQQIRYCYSYNKKSPNPVLASVTGLTGGPTTTNDRGFPSVRQLLERETGFCEWKRRMFDCTEDTLEDYYGLSNTASTTTAAATSADVDDADVDVDAAASADGETFAQPRPRPPRPRIVYLTSDSPRTLHRLEEQTVYVLGGIVDRNRLKGATLRRATEELDGVETARLPLEEYLRENDLTMPTTKVLTVNHVFDILLRCHQHGGDWGAAFREVLPSRKSVG